MNLIKCTLCLLFYISSEWNGLVEKSINIQSFFHVISIDKFECFIAPNTRSKIDLNSNDF